MKALIDLILCRVIGRRCTVRRPASKDLARELRAHARKAEAETIEIRRRRESWEALRGSGR